MYVWLTNDMAKDLKNEGISSYDNFVYSFGTFIFILLRLTVFSWPSNLYRMTIGFIKAYLEKKAEPAQLFITIYSYADNYLFLALAGISIIGLVSCYLANKDRKFFIRRFICLSWVINIRIIVLFSILFAVVICIFGFIYLPKLMALSAKPLNTANPIKFLFGVIKRVTIIGPIVGKIQSLQKATIIFNQINAFSSYLYFACNISTILGASWYFMRIRSYLSRISR
jgi:hypothetical protein